jgi:RNA polymerase sigma factor (sigma-70 family)
MSLLPISDGVISASAMQEPEILSSWIEKIAQNQDKEAFSALFDHFAPRLNATLRKLGTSPEQAEEVVQDTLLAVWRNASQFDRRKASPSTWIYTIARNRRIDLLRKTRRPEMDFHDPALVPDSEDSAESKSIKDTEETLIRKAIAELPAEQAELLQLAFYEEKTHKRIAIEKNLPLGTVKSRLRLALDKMRRILEYGV